MMLNNGHKDIEIFEEEQAAFYNEIIDDIINKIVKYSLDKSSAYTIDGVRYQSRRTLSDLIDIIRTGILNWDDKISNIYEEYTESLSQAESAPCRCCGACYKGSDLKSAELRKKFWGDAYKVSEYFQLCNSCAEEYTYSFHDLHFKCEICNNRHSSRGHHGKGLSEQKMKMLCENCANIPNIWREVDRVKSHIIRALGLNLSATLTIGEWLRTLEYFSWKCAYCLDEFTCIEHFLPESKGGKTSIDNCIPACDKCNRKKNRTHPDKLDHLFSSENLARIREYLSQQSA